MKMPWNLKGEVNQKKKEIDQLQDEIGQMRKERDKWKKKFEAEKDRRSKLSRQKQEAERRKNRLKDKLEEKSVSETSEESDQNDKGIEELNVKNAVNLLKKLGSISSDREELVTVYSPENLDQISELKSLKNSVSGDHFSALKELKSFVAFSDPDLGVFIMKCAPFFREKVEVAESFQTEDLLDFIKSEKYWCRVSAGNTSIIREESGAFKEVEKVRTRVDHEHSKGGFSQSRFERKREEQIEDHIEKVEEKLEEYDKVYLMGDKRLCNQLNGKYIGGFNPNRKMPEQLYRLRFTAFY